MRNFYVKSDIIGKNVKIINTSNIGEDILMRRLLSVPSLKITKDCGNYAYIIEISNEKVSVSGELSFEFEGGLSQSDSYVFIHAIFYRIFYDNGYICVHAGAVSDTRGNVTIFVGDFGSGKSCLNKFFAENGYEICSADHCLIKIENERLMFVSGSCFNMFEGVASCLEYQKCNKKMPISKIFVLQGVQDNGDLEVKEINNLETIAKKMSSHMFWPYFSGAISIKEKIFIRMFPKEMLHCLNFWKSIEKIYICRGDKAKIFESIKNEGGF